MNALGLGHVHARLIRRLFGSAAVRVRLARTARVVHRRRFHSLDARSSASLASHLSRARVIPRNKKSVHVSTFHSKKGLAPTQSSRHRHRHPRHPTKSKKTTTAEPTPMACTRPVVESSVAFSLVAFASLAYLGRHARRDGCVEGDHLFFSFPSSGDDASRTRGSGRRRAPCVDTCVYVFLVTCRMSDGYFSMFNCRSVSFFYSTNKKPPM